MHLVVASSFETRPSNEKAEIKPEDERKIILSTVNFNMQSSCARSGERNVRKALEFFLLILGGPADVYRRSQIT